MTVPSTDPILDAGSATDQVDEKQHDRDHEQDVNGARRDLERQAEHPENQEQNDQCPEHVAPPIHRFINVRASDRNHQRILPGFLTFSTGRAPCSVTVGLPAASHAPTISPAVAPIASPSRSSRIGFTRVKKASKYSSS